MLQPLALAFFAIVAILACGIIGRDLINNRGAIVRAIRNRKG